MSDEAYQDILHGKGYHLLKEVISPDEAATVRDLALSKLDEGVDQNGQIAIRSTLHWGPIIQNMVTNPRLLNLAHRLLGEDATLGAVTARILPPNCPPGGLHVDYPYWAMNPGLPVDPALMMQVIWMMEPFTEHNGGTWVAPGSQLWTGAPELERFEANAMQAIGNAGDAVVSHGLLWHRTAINHADKPRVAILINYTQLAVRPLTQLGPFDDEFIANASEPLKALLAVDMQKALGRRLRAHAQQT
jgi:hypothetical protein